jgi:hypothetical protein
MAEAVDVTGTVLAEVEIAAGEAGAAGADAISGVRIIKGRPFEIGFGCDAKLYRKGHPQ